MLMLCLYFGYLPMEYSEIYIMLNGPAMRPAATITPAGAASPFFLVGGAGGRPEAVADRPATHVHTPNAKTVGR